PAVSLAAPPPPPQRRRHRRRSGQGRKPMAVNAVSCNSAPATPATRSSRRRARRSMTRCAKRRVASWTGCSDMRIHTIDLAIVALCALALAACGKEPSPEQQAEAARADVQATVDRLANLPSDPEQAAAELQAMGKDLEKRMAEAKAAEQPAVADACAFFDEADIREIGRASCRERVLTSGADRIG